MAADGSDTPEPADAPATGASPRRSPLTDPRALGSSLAFHLVLLTLASLLALRVSTPVEPPPPATVRAELGPIDNRAPTEPGGGGPGELGGTGDLNMPRITAERMFGHLEGGAIDRTAADLLDLPAGPPSPDEVPSDLPGPPISEGVGILPGRGLGGGGGSGGGSGGGIGRGLGPSTSFFGASERAGSFAYAIDRSGSMSGRGSLELAKRELLASLQLLPPDARFCVLFYNLEAHSLLDPNGPPSLAPATAANKEQVQSRLEGISGVGGTNHARALRAAFSARPEVVFLLTDGLHMTREQAEAIRSEAGAIRVHVIEFGLGPSPGTEDPVRWLAASCGGTYRYIDVQRYRPGIQADRPASRGGG
jgi:hypothetical protein